MSRRLPGRLAQVWLVVIAVWSLRTAWLSAAYVIGWAEVARRHVESAVFVLAALVAPLVLWRAFQPRDPIAAAMRRVPAGLVCALLVTVSLVLYWPALGIGLLSDDFVLLRRAAAGALLDPEWEFARPVPLAIWGLIGSALPFDAVPPALHLLNVLLHGVNAFLVFLLGRALTSNDALALLAALLVVTFPGSVEAVAWASGVFDVMLATAALSACLAPARERVSLAGHVLAASATAVALGTKEVGIAIPVLIAAATFVVAGVRRADGYLAAAWCAVPVGLYLAVRVAGDLDASVFPPLTGYAFKELFTRPFAALAMPFHERTVAMMPWAVAAGASIAPILVALACAASLRTSTQHAGLVAGACAWIMAAAAPLFTLFYVGPDLQGARYTYLPVAGWSILFAFCVSNAFSVVRTAVSRTAAAAVVGACAAAWLGVGAVGVRAHLVPWMNAAQVRDEVLASMAARARECPDVSVSGLPDHVQGAYVFRNGFSEALDRAGVRARVHAAPVASAACHIDLARRAF